MTSPPVQARRAPLAGPLQRLASGTLADIPSSVTAYLRDVADHHTTSAPPSA
jgi:hypothetical protein